MAAPGGWQRSKYPLQATSESPALPNPMPKKEQAPVNVPVEPDVEVDRQSIDDQAPWHRAVHQRRVKRYSITSSAGSESNISLQHSINDSQAIDGLSTAFSTSQRSVSPLPAIHDILMHPEQVEDSVSAIHPTTISQRTLSKAFDKRARNFSYPLQPTTEVTTATMSDSSRATSPETENGSRPNSSESNHGLGRKKTLRRTPRNRRLHDIASAQTSEFALSRTSPVQDVLGTHLEDVQAHDGNADAMAWKRQRYPLQSAKSPSAAHLESNTLTGTAPSTFANVLKHPQDSESTSVSQNLQPIPVQAAAVTPINESTPSPSPDSTADDTQKTLSTRTAREEYLATTIQPQRRRKYPLQAPISHVKLRQSPTPPSSPERNPSDVTEGSGRQTYPLQATTSRAEGTSQLTPPSSPDRELDHSRNSSRRGRGMKRQQYPLQDPASIVDLRSHSKPSIPAKAAAEPNLSSPSNTLDKKPVDIRTAGSRRRGYPLQSPASVMNLQALTTPPRSGAVAKPEQKNKLNTELLHHSDDPAKQAVLTQSQHYPIQVSVAEEHALDLSSEQTQRAKGEAPTIKTPVPNTASHNSLAVPGAQGGHTAAALTAREGELATKVLNQWRKISYPLQSPKHVEPFPRSPTPQPPEEKERSSEPVHIPKNIHAIQDVDKPLTKGRTIVVCLDGTGDKFDNDNSNIVHLIAALKKDDPNQVSYYQAGIGTYSSNGLSSGAEAALDMAIGSGLGLHVRDAYHFLMHSYKEGDRICIFGFSRGAYTARCLAGMIHKVGLLPPRNIQQIAFAYEFYKNDTPDGWKQSDDFKKTFSIEVCVHFLGCFDSVASVGFIPRQLPLASTPTNKPRYFRHAMALDERRAKFKICRHETKHIEDIEKPSSPGISTDLWSYLPTVKNQNDRPPEYSPHAKYFGKHNHPNVSDEEYERLTGHEAPFDTDVLEVWFTGAHADVGGGAVPNDERHKLAQIPLRWMIRQAFDCNTGIIFKTKVLAEYGLDVHTLWPKYTSLNAPSHGPPPSLIEKYESGLPPRSIRRSKLVPIDRHEKGEHFYHLKSPEDEDWTPEQVEDFFDAMSPLNDQLVQAPNWWILEFWPVEYKVPIKPGVVKLVTGANLGRYRGVDDEVPNLHWTVQHRMRQQGYKIQARTAAHTMWKTVV